MNILETELFADAINGLSSSTKQNISIINDACDVNCERFNNRIATKLNNWPWFNSSIESYHKADENYLIVGLASIIAKQTRDMAIKNIEEKLGFNIGSGYPSDKYTVSALELLLKDEPHQDVTLVLENISKIMEKDSWNRDTKTKITAKKSVNFVLTNHLVLEVATTRWFMDWSMDAETEKMLWHLAIQNAVEYDGKGSPGSVIGRVMSIRQDLRQYGKIINPIVAQNVAKANQLAQNMEIEHLTEILENEAPDLLQEEKKERREGLPELNNITNGK